VAVRQMEIGDDEKEGFQPVKTLHFETEAAKERKSLETNEGKSGWRRDAFRGVYILLCITLSRIQFGAII
jgi:hypothetical protein